MLAAAARPGRLRPHLGLTLPLVALVLAVAVVSALVALLARRWPRVGPDPPRTASRRARRLDPGASTGLALTVAAGGVLAGALLLAVLALVLRSDPGAIAFDASAARWADAHATPFTTDVLTSLTNVGRPLSIITLAIALALVEVVRTRNLWIVPFLVLVIWGNGMLTTTIKHFDDRVRPGFNPVAHLLGPSFPSGHTSWTAAFFAAAALVLARDATRRQRIALAAAAAGMATAIACTRVLLDVHWVSDVVGGIALGWAWFAVCAIAFGGRLLRFGAPAERPLAAARA